MLNVRRLIVAALFSLAACSSTDEGGLSKADQLNLHVEYAKKFFSDGQYAQAEQQADLGLALSRKDHELLLIKGWVRIKRGRTDDVLMAERIFRDIDSSDDYRAHIGLGEALERKGVLYWESAKAVESGERATNAADPAKRAKELRVDAERFWAESEALYKRALESKSSAIQAINGLQRVAALRGDHEQALAWSERLLETSQQELAFWRKDLQRPNLNADDENAIRRLLNGGEQLVLETHLQASTMLVKLGRKAEGVAHLDAATELAPDRAEIYSRRAQLLHELGDHQRARADIQAFLKLSKLPVDHPDVQRALDLLTECEVALNASKT